MTEGRNKSDSLEDRVVATLARRGLVKRKGGIRRGGAIAAMCTVLVVVMTFPTLWLVDSTSSAAARPNYMIALYTTANYRPEHSASLQSRAKEYAEWAHSHSTGEHSIIAGGELTREVSLTGQPVDSGDKLAGYFLVRAKTREDAIALAQSSPHLRYGGTVVLYEIGR